MLLKVKCYNYSNSLGNDSFAFLGAGAPVFGSASKGTEKKVDKSNVSNNEFTNETADEEEYDPHYEPIVPLPDAIVVCTGEEDEITQYNERAKLYRFDTDSKEWKERGVGQLKILYHPENRKYENRVFSNYFCTHFLKKKLKKPFFFLDSFALSVLEK